MDRDISARSYTRRKKTAKGNGRRIEKDKIKFHRKRRKRERETGNGKEKSGRESTPRALASRSGGGKFNFDPVDSAVIPKFNL